MRVYIAGKISGLQYVEACRNFAIAEAQLKRRGYKVVNPIKLCPEGWSWWRCMVVCILNLLACSRVYMLPNWTTSRGAKIERRWAMATGKRVHYL